MKLSVLYLLLVSLLISSCSDELSDLQKKSFVKFYGSFQNDAGNDVKTLSSGGYAIVGNIVPDSVSKMAIIFTDDAGNQLEHSPHFYGGKYKTGGNTLLVLDNGYLIGGCFYDTTANGKLQSDMYLVRIDAAGNEIWSRRYGGEGNDDLYHVIRRKGSGYILAGKKNTGGQDDLWVLMVDEEGKKMFELTGSDMQDDDEANYLVRTESGYVCACTYNEGARAGTDIFIISIDENCNIVDTKATGTEDDDAARAIISYNDAYLVMGNAINSTTGLNEISLSTFSVEDGLIKNLDGFATISDFGTDLTGESCCNNVNGGIAIIGTREANDNRDMLLLLVNSDGTVDKDKDGGLGIYFGGVGNQVGKAIDQTKDGGLIFTGSNALEGNSLISLVKTNSGGQL